jgi:hypothetical protein
MDLKKEYELNRKDTEKYLLNRERNKELSNLSVSTIINGTEETFDADKISEDNIKTAILAMNENDSTTWITADNKFVTLSVSQLKEVLKKISDTKRDIVFKYRKLKDEIKG